MEPNKDLLNDGAKKKKGRRKIEIAFIEEKSRRHITFSKRKAGIMKKAYELATLTGTQVLLLVASETGHVYTFATPKLQPLITKPEGKNLIQACLNAPDAPNNVPAPGVGNPVRGPMGAQMGNGGAVGGLPQHGGAVAAAVPNAQPRGSVPLGVNYAGNMEQPQNAMYNHPPPQEQNRHANGIAQAKVKTEAESEIKPSTQLPQPMLPNMMPGPGGMPGMPGGMRGPQGNMPYARMPGAMPNAYAQMPNGYPNFQGQQPPQGYIGQGGVMFSPPGSSPPPYK